MMYGGGARSCLNLRSEALLTPMGGLPLSEEWVGGWVGRRGARE